MKVTARQRTLLANEEDCLDHLEHDVRGLTYKPNDPMAVHKEAAAKGIPRSVRTDVMKYMTMTLEHISLEWCDDPLMLLKAMSDASEASRAHLPKLKGRNDDLPTTG